MSLSDKRSVCTSSSHRVSISTKLAVVKEKARLSLQAADESIRMLQHTQHLYCLSKLPICVPKAHSPRDQDLEDKQ